MKHKKAFKQAIQQLQYNDKEKFHSKAQKVKLELLADLWEKAESALDPASKQIPALLGEASMKVPTRNELMQYNLTRSDMQRLSAMLSETISMYEAQIIAEKELAADFWDRCDPADASTAVYYKELNISKKLLKEWKQNVKKLQVMQTKIKRSLRK